MFRSYFKIAWRNMMRHKAYSGINILGLAIGIAACLLILQYVSYELSYENFQSNKDRLYRVQQDRYDKGKLSTQVGSRCLCSWKFFQRCHSRNRRLCKGCAKRKSNYRRQQPASES
jgi:putative ABC transport system permease protein